MNLEAASTIFFHGIGGSGMRGLAWLLAEKGRTVRGADMKLPADLPPAFQVAKETEAERLLDGCQLYIHSDAVAGDHPLLQAAIARNITVYTYQQALGELSHDYTTIAVAGTHGKSSTTAFLAHILVAAGLDPTVLVGASMPTWPGKHARLGNSNLFIIEADEYRDHFLTLAPTYEVITTIEHDHPDYFPSLAEVLTSFQSFIRLLPSDGTLVIPAALRELQLTFPAHTADVPSGHLPHAPLPGAHMQLNAALAIATAKLFGVDEQVAEQHLQTFPGLGRRFEIIGTIGKMVVVSDYAHHPTEIAATIAAARTRYPDKRIALVFEAHTADRLLTFMDEFAAVLTQADGVVLYPPFIPEGRGVESRVALMGLQKNLQRKGVLIQSLDKRVELQSALIELAKTYDVTLACTAGQLDGDLRDVLKSVS